jgi:hypothetical protein
MPDNKGNNNNGNQLSVELKPEAAQGSYSNLAIISHSQSEFVLDFATMLPGPGKAIVGNRIIMTPDHAKRLLNALQDNILKYENEFGYIDLEGAKNGKGGTFNIEDMFGGKKN